MFRLTGDQVEKSVTSAAIVPRRPRQNVSATNANNPDTFSPPARLESDMFDQPIHGSGACTSSGLDDGMDSSSLFVHWIPLASTCGIGAASPRGTGSFYSCMIFSVCLCTLRRSSQHLSGPCLLSSFPMLGKWIYTFQHCMSGRKYVR